MGLSSDRSDMLTVNAAPKGADNSNLAESYKYFGLTGL